MKSKIIKTKAIGDVILNYNKGEFIVNLPTSMNSINYNEWLVKHKVEIEEFKRECKETSK